MGAVLIYLSVGAGVAVVTLALIVIDALRAIRGIKGHWSDWVVGLGIALIAAVAVGVLWPIAAWTLGRGRLTDRPLTTERPHSE